MEATITIQVKAPDSEKDSLDSFAGNVQAYLMNWATDCKPVLLAMRTQGFSAPVSFMWDMSADSEPKPA